MVERAICGEPMCKMQSLQLNNLKHNRNENPIPFRMPCRNCRRRHKPTTNVAFVRSQLCMRRRGRQRPSSAFHPDSRICGNAISTRDVNCIRAILGSTNAQNMARDMLEIAQNAMQAMFCQYFMDVHDAMGGRSRMGIAFRPSKTGDKLTVRGESGNRHGRREAGSRQGVTTLQHGQGSISSL